MLLIEADAPLGDNGGHCEGGDGERDGERSRVGLLLGDRA